MAFVKGDSTALTVMVRNLVDNAIRYSPEGGHVNLCVYSDGDHVFLLIEDTGPGIAPSDLDIIFEPFNRGSLAKGDGTGLGLSIGTPHRRQSRGIDQSSKYDFIGSYRPSSNCPLARGIVQ